MKGSCGKRCRLLVSGAAGLTLLLLGATASFAGTPGRMVEVSRGKLGDTEWVIGMAQIHRQHCYGMVTLRGGWEGDSRICDADPRPAVDWRRVLGDAGEGNEVSIELDVTSRRVWTLELLIAHPGSNPFRPAAWRLFHTHVLNPKQARISHLSRDFRFAVISDRGDLCVEAVRALDRHGDQVLDEKVPCEY